MSYITREMSYIHHIREQPLELIETWRHYKSFVGKDKWRQYGDDIQFRTVERGAASEWWQDFEKRYDLPERNREPQFVRFGPKSSVPIHRDPESLAWIAVTVIGEQPIEFYDMNKEKLYETKYDFALVNSKQPHFCDVRGKERVLFRKIYTETSYDTLFQLLN